MAILTKNSLTLSLEGKPIIGSEYIEALTISKALTGKTLAQYCLENNKKKVESGQPLEVNQVNRALVITFISKRINELKIWVKNDWSADDITMFAKKILATYPTLRPDELAYYFNEGINGNYSKIYGNTVYLDLVEWIKQGLNKAAQHYEETHTQQKFETIVGPNSPQIKTLIQQIGTNGQQKKQFNNEL